MEKDIKSIDDLLDPIPTKSIDESITKPKIERSSSIVKMAQPYELSLTDNTRFVFVGDRGLIKSDVGLSVLIEELKSIDFYAMRILEIDSPFSDSTDPIYISQNDNLSWEYQIPVPRKYNIVKIKNIVSDYFKSNMAYPPKVHIVKYNKDCPNIKGSILISYSTRKHFKLLSQSPLKIRPGIYLTGKFVADSAHGLRQHIIDSKNFVRTNECSKPRKWFHNYKITPSFIIFVVILLTSYFYFYFYTGAN